MTRLRPFAPVLTNIRESPARPHPLTPLPQTSGPFRNRKLLSIGKRWWKWWRWWWGRPPFVALILLCSVEMRGRVGRGRGEEGLWMDCYIMLLVLQICVHFVGAIVRWKHNGTAGLGNRSTIVFIPTHCHTIYEMERWLRIENTRQPIRKPKPASSLCISFSDIRIPILYIYYGSGKCSASCKTWK